MVFVQDRIWCIDSLDPRIKLLYCLTVSLLVILIDNYLVLYSLFFMTVIIWGLSKPRYKDYVLALGIICTFIISASISQALFYRGTPRTVIFTLIPAEVPVLGKITGGLFVHREGFFYGITQSFRYLAMLFAGFFTVRTTHSSELVLGLTYYKVPHVFAFMVTVALRSIPILINRTNRILQAQQMRGLKTKGIRGMMRAVNYLLIPLVVSTLRDIRQLGLAAEVRAYSGTRTSINTLKFTRYDTLSLIVLILILTSSLTYSYFTSSLNLGELF